MGNTRTILFTAFEPSGDAMAAPLIAGLRRDHPEIRIAAFGGPKMAEAGAELIQNTTERAVMLLGAVGEANSHRVRLAVMARWLADHDLHTLVPVDSPAANWSICRMVRRMHPMAKIVHLVAPQLWAWAPWRIRKLRRLTDHVMCMLPFEPDWFEQRGVAATFVGHPVFDQPANDHEVQDHANPPGTGHGQILALLPGSRTGEIRANLPTCIRAIVSLHAKYPDLRTRVCATNESVEKLIHSIGNRVLPGEVWQQLFDVSVGALDDTLRRSSVACVVSGTVTLSVAKHETPMVIVYHINRWMWHLLGRWLVRTRTFTLPNLIAEADGLDGVVPEFIPHFGAIEPLAAAIEQLIHDQDSRQAQRGMFASVAAHYRNAPYHKLVLERFCEQAGL